MNRYLAVILFTIMALPLIPFYMFVYWKGIGYAWNEYSSSVVDIWKN